MTNVALSLKIARATDAAFKFRKLRLNHLGRYKLHQMESRLAKMKRRAEYYVGRLDYYNQRIEALRSRTRFDKMLRSPVI